MLLKKHKPQEKSNHSKVQMLFFQDVASLIEKKEFKEALVCFADNISNISNAERSICEDEIVILAGKSKLCILLNYILSSSLSLTLFNKYLLLSNYPRDSRIMYIVCILKIYFLSATPPQKIFAGTNYLAGMQGYFLLLVNSADYSYIISFLSQCSNTHIYIRKISDEPSELSMQT